MAYEAPTISTLGTVQDLTLLPAKCGGSGDAFTPAELGLSPRIDPDGDCTS